MTVIEVAVPVKSPLNDVAVSIPVTETPVPVVVSFSAPASNILTDPVPPAELSSSGVLDASSLIAILPFNAPSNLKSIKLT